MSRSLTIDQSKTKKSTATFNLSAGVGVGQYLKKNIVDLSKTKKRKEFEHDIKIEQKLTTLVTFSQISQAQTKTARKVGRKVISEID